MDSLASTSSGEAGPAGPSSMPILPSEETPVNKGQLSPLTGSYLLIVISEPHSEEDREKVIQRLTKGLLAWDTQASHVDLNCELLNLSNSAPEGDTARNGEKLVQWASESLVVEVLIHSQVNTLLQCMKNLLSSFTRHRHIIHAGYSYQGSGSWLLQDGTFSITDFIELWDEHEVKRLLSAYKGDVNVALHCAPDNGWTDERFRKEPFTKLCQVDVNGEAKLAQIHNAGILSFVEYISKFIVAAPLKDILQSSDIVGNIRFSHPTLYVFPGGQGDAALFGVNGFNMLIDGGFSRKACFYDFTRHLDRLDAVLLTRVNSNSMGGLAALLERKSNANVYPQIGHFFGNIVERKGGDESEKKPEDDLIISLTEQGSSMFEYIRGINMKPQFCFRENVIEPINLYHKVGHGKLDLFVLNPAKDSRELKEFLSRWKNDAGKAFATSRMNIKVDGQLCSYPILNLVSICALVVWQPANPRDRITRILFPGSTPQQKIFDSLSKLKHLEFLRFPVCTAKSIAASHKSNIKSDKVISEVRHHLKSRSTSAAESRISKTSSASSLPKDTKAQQNRAEKQLLTGSGRGETNSSSGSNVTAAGEQGTLSSSSRVVKGDETIKKVESRKVEISKQTGPKATSVASQDNKVKERESRISKFTATSTASRKGEAITAISKTSSTSRVSSAKPGAVPISATKKVDSVKQPSQESPKKEEAVKKAGAATPKKESGVKKQSPTEAKSDEIKKASPVSPKKEDAKKQSPLSPKKEEESPKKESPTKAEADSSVDTKTVTKSASKPVVATQKYGISKSITKTSSTTTAAVTTSSPKQTKEATNRKVVEHKGAPVQRPGSLTKTPAADKEKPKPTVEVKPKVASDVKPKAIPETKPKASSEVKPKTQRPGTAKPAPSSSASKANGNKPVAISGRSSSKKEIVGVVAAAGLATAAVATAVAATSNEDRKPSVDAGAEKKIKVETNGNGVASPAEEIEKEALPAEPTPEPMIAPLIERENGTLGTTESSSELSSLDHASVSEEPEDRPPTQASSTDQAEDQHYEVHTPSSVQDETPKAERLEIVTYPEDEEEDEYLVVEKPVDEGEEEQAFENGTAPQSLDYEVIEYSEESEEPHHPVALDGTHIQEMTEEGDSVEVAIESQMPQAKTDIEPSVSGEEKEETDTHEEPEPHALSPSPVVAASHPDLSRDDNESATPQKHVWGQVRDDEDLEDSLELPANKNIAETKSGSVTSLEDEEEPKPTSMAQLEETEEPANDKLEESSIPETSSKTPDPSSTEHKESQDERSGSPGTREDVNLYSHAGSEEQMERGTPGLESESFGPKETTPSQPIQTETSAESQSELIKDQAAETHAESASPAKDELDSSFTHKHQIGSDGKEESSEKIDSEYERIEKISITATKLAADSDSSDTDQFLNDLHKKTNGKSESLGDASPNQFETDEIILNGKSGLPLSASSTSSRITLPEVEVMRSASGTSQAGGGGFVSSTEEYEVDSDGYGSGSFTADKSGILETHEEFPEKETGSGDQVSTFPVDRHEPRQMLKDEGIQESLSTAGVIEESGKEKVSQEKETKVVEKEEQGLVESEPLSLETQATHTQFEPDERVSIQEPEVISKTTQLQEAGAVQSIKDESTTKDSEICVEEPCIRKTCSLTYKQEVIEEAVAVVGLTQTEKLIEELSRSHYDDKDTVPESLAKHEDHVVSALNKTEAHVTSTQEKKDETHVEYVLEKTEHHVVESHEKAEESKVAASEKADEAKAEKAEASPFESSKEKADDSEVGKVEENKNQSAEPRESLPEKEISVPKEEKVESELLGKQENKTVVPVSKLEGSSQPLPTAIRSSIPRDLKDVVRTPDEVAELPVHYEVEPGTYETDECLHSSVHEEEDDGEIDHGIENTPIARIHTPAGAEQADEVEKVAVVESAESKVETTELGAAPVKQEGRENQYETQEILEEHEKHSRELPGVEGKTEIESGEIIADSPVPATADAALSPVSESLLTQAGPENRGIIHPLPESSVAERKSSLTQEQAGSGSEVAAEKKESLPTTGSEDPVVAQPSPVQVGADTTYSHLESEDEDLCEGAQPKSLEMSKPITFSGEPVVEKAEGRVPSQAHDLMLRHLDKDDDPDDHLNVIHEEENEASSPLSVKTVTSVVITPSTPPVESGDGSFFGATAAAHEPMQSPSKDAEKEQQDSAKNAEPAPKSSQEITPTSGQEESKNISEHSSGNKSPEEHDAVKTEERSGSTPKKESSEEASLRAHEEDKKGASDGDESSVSSSAMTVISQTTSTAAEDELQALAKHFDGITKSTPDPVLDDLAASSLPAALHFQANTFSDKPEFGGSGDDKASFYVGDRGEGPHHDDIHRSDVEDDEIYEIQSENFAAGSAIRAGLLTAVTAASATIMRRSPEEYLEHLTSGPSSVDSNTAAGHDQEEEVKFERCRGYSLDAAATGSSHDNERVGKPIFQIGSSSRSSIASEADESLIEKVRSQRSSITSEVDEPIFEKVTLPRDVEKAEETEKDEAPIFEKVHLKRESLVSTIDEPVGNLPLFPEKDMEEQKAEKVDVKAEVGSSASKMEQPHLQDDIKKTEQDKVPDPKSGQKQESVSDIDEPKGSVTGIQQREHRDSASSEVEEPTFKKMVLHKEVHLSDTPSEKGQEKSEAKESKMGHDAGDDLNLHATPSKESSLKSEQVEAVHLNQGESGVVAEIEAAMLEAQVQDDYENSPSQEKNKSLDSKPTGPLSPEGNTAAQGEISSTKESSFETLSQTETITQDTGKISSSIQQESRSVEDSFESTALNKTDPADKCEPISAPEIEKKSDLVSDSAASSLVSSISQIQKAVIESTSITTTLPESQSRLSEGVKSEPELQSPKSADLSPPSGTSGAVSSEVIETGLGRAETIYGTTKEIQQELQEDNGSALSSSETRAEKTSLYKHESHSVGESYEIHRETQRDAENNDGILNKISNSSEQTHEGASKEKLGGALEGFISGTVTVGQEQRAPSLESHVIGELSPSSLHYSNSEVVEGKGRTLEELEAAAYINQGFVQMESDTRERTTTLIQLPAEHGDMPENFGHQSISTIDSTADAGQSNLGGTGLQTKLSSDSAEIKTAGSEGAPFQSLGSHHPSSSAQSGFSATSADLGVDGSSISMFLGADGRTRTISSSSVESSQSQGSSSQSSQKHEGLIKSNANIPEAGFEQAEFFADGKTIPSGSGITSTTVKTITSSSRRFSTQDSPEPSPILSELQRRGSEMIGMGHPQPSTSFIMKGTLEDARGGDGSGPESTPSPDFLLGAGASALERDQQFPSMGETGRDRSEEQISFSSSPRTMTSTRTTIEEIGDPSSSYSTHHTYQTFGVGESAGGEAGFNAGDRAFPQPGFLDSSSLVGGQRLFDMAAHQLESGSFSLAHHQQELMDDEQTYSSGEFSDSQLSTVPPPTFDMDEEGFGFGSMPREFGFKSNLNQERDAENGNMNTLTGSSSSTTTTTTRTIISSTSDNGNLTGGEPQKWTTTTTTIRSSNIGGDSAEPETTTTTVVTSGTGPAAKFPSLPKEGEQPDEEDEDLVAKKWGKPLGLPAVHPDDTSLEPSSATPGKDGKSSAKIASTPKQSKKPYRTRHAQPIYLDLAYVPHHGNANYSDSEYFRLIRSRYYVMSGIEPSREVFDGLLQGKQEWEDKNLDVTIIPTYDTDTLGYWVAESEAALAEARIDLAPSASRCTINLQDHETSCSAYRLEF